MPRQTFHIAVLAVCWLLLTGTGAYFTYYAQPKELDRVQKAEKVARLKYAELESLRSEEAMLSMMTEEAVRKWQARYKIIPDTLSSPEVIGYLNGLSRSGFENFDVTFDGTRRRPSFSYHSFTISGRGYYSSLYNTIWELENNAHLYGVRELKLDHIDLVKTDQQTGSQRLQVMVSFDVHLDAYYSGIAGASAHSNAARALGGEDLLPVTTASLPDIPPHLLPARRPAANPFFPVIMDALPPNTHGYVDVEEADLVSIAGDGALFAEKDGFRTVHRGDPVYLGQVVEVDPAAGRVVARLNKGGIIDEVEIYLQTGARRRQALGPVAPVE